MKRKALFLGLLASILVLASGCGSRGDVPATRTAVALITRDARETEVAATVFARQTEEAPAPKPRRAPRKKAEPVAETAAEPADEPEETAETEETEA